MAHFEGPRAPTDRIIENELIFNVVGTLGLMLFVAALLLWSMARVVRGAHGSH